MIIERLLNFSKWQYSTDNGATWADATPSPAMSFAVPCDMMLRALYVNETAKPTVDLSSNAYIADGQIRSTIQFNMNYKLPDGYTFVDAGIRTGDNEGISYYEIIEKKWSASKSAAYGAVGVAMS